MALKSAGTDWGLGRTAFADAPHAHSGSSSSELSDSHAFGRSATPFRASAGSFGTDPSGRTDFSTSGASAMSVADAKAPSNLDAADTFPFAPDFGKAPDWSAAPGDTHHDLSGHVTFDDLLGADHAAFADCGMAFDGLHADPLKGVAHAGQHGDDFHTA